MKYLQSVLDVWDYPAVIPTFPEKKKAFVSLVAL